MELEFAAGARPTSEGYDFGVLQAEEGGGPVLVADWQHLIRAMLQDAASGVPTGLMAAKFHNALVELIVAVARQAGEPRVALTGGCFQNRYLTEQAVARLRAEGFLPLWHRRVPPNDGGIALGQVRMALSSQQRGGV
jgi:hydrogenase maturation protein HypF